MLIGDLYFAVASLTMRLCRDGWERRSRVQVVRKSLLGAYEKRRRSECNAHNEGKENNITSQVKQSLMSMTAGKQP